MRCLIKLAVNSLLLNVTVAGAKTEPGYSLSMAETGAIAVSHRLLSFLIYRVTRQE